jgi:hypothetical protein
MAEHTEHHAQTPGSFRKTLVMAEHTEHHAQTPGSHPFVYTKKYKQFKFNKKRKEN